MSNSLIATLSSWICNLCTAAPQILILCQFETIHMAQWHTGRFTWIVSGLVVVMFTSQCHWNCRACNAFLRGWKLLGYYLGIYTDRQNKFSSCQNILAQSVNTIAPNPWDLEFDSRSLEFLRKHQTILILLFLLHVRSLAHGQQRASFTDSLYGI